MTAEIYQAQRTYIKYISFTEVLNGMRHRCNVSFYKRVIKEFDFNALMFQIVTFYPKSDPPYLIVVRGWSFLFVEVYIEKSFLAIVIPIWFCLLMAFVFCFLFQRISITVDTRISCFKWSHWIYLTWFYWDISTKIIHANWYLAFQVLPIANCLTFRRSKTELHSGLKSFNIGDYKEAVALIL